LERLVRAPDPEASAEPWGFATSGRQALASSLGPPQPGSSAERRFAGVDYRWIALSNTTLGILMAGLNGSVVMIALPAIFRGLGVDPLAPGESDFLLWSLMSYSLVTAVLLVSAGRISDMFGRVRLYNAGFAIFTVGSVLCFLIQGQGDGAAVQLIVFRVVQGIGGAFLMANSAAILTDAFPPNQRGFAMGMNQIGLIAGTFLGFLVGGVLATVDWRLVFLASVPIGLAGTVWAYLVLHETATIRAHQRLDVPGNALFAVGLTLLLIGFTYAIQPYGGDSMGWSSPWVIGELSAGAILLAAFLWYERRAPDPMFRLELFGIRMFSAGNAAGFLSSLARGGLQFILIVWLQGIWLPLHGYRFEDAPLWAAIYMVPMTAGFLAAGPISGRLSDRYGARYFSTGGMLLGAVAFVGLMGLPADFEYPPFALLLVLLGLGMGAFASPNTASIMSSVPAEHRGASSGMRATFQNVATSLSMTLIMTLVVGGLASSLPAALSARLLAVGTPPDVAARVAAMPPIGALFAAFLGYNPMSTLIPPATLAGLPATTQATLLGSSFFPGILAGPFVDGLRLAFAVCVGLSLLAAAASWLRGQQTYASDDASAPGRVRAAATPRLSARTPANVPASGPAPGNVPGPAKPPARPGPASARAPGSGRAGP